MTNVHTARGRAPRAPSGPSHAPPTEYRDRYTENSGDDSRHGPTVTLTVRMGSRQAPAAVKNTNGRARAAGHSDIGHNAAS
eukprot:522912-Prymnesium_polylepis.1